MEAFPVRYLQVNYELAHATTPTELRTKLATMLADSPDTNDVAMTQHHDTITRHKIAEYISKTPLERAEQQKAAGPAATEITERDTVYFTHINTARHMAFRRLGSLVFPIDDRNCTRTIVICPVFNPLEVLLHANWLLEPTEEGSLRRDKYSVIEKVSIKNGVSFTFGTLVEAMQAEGFNSKKIALRPHDPEIEQFDERLVGLFLLHAARIG